MSKQTKIRQMTIPAPGFTLVELLTCILILVLLGTIIGNAIQTYVVRGQVRDGIALANLLKPTVVKHLQDKGDFPANRSDAGIDPEPTASSNAYVKSIGITSGRLDITFSSDAHPTIADTVLTLTPVPGPENSVSWACGQPPATNVPPRYQPGSCR